MVCSEIECQDLNFISSQFYFIPISYSIHSFNFESPILKMNVHFLKKSCTYVLIIKLLI